MLNRTHILFFVLCFLLLKPVLNAQILPSADTFVSASNPTLNYGTSPILVVQPGTVVYIKFDLSSLPVDASVKRATLRLYVDTLVKPGSFGVFPVLSDWSEDTLAYGPSMPKLGTSPLGRPISISSFSLNNYVLADVTALVQSWVSGNIPNNGLALMLTSAGGTFSFDAREALLTGNAPELEITLMERASDPGTAAHVG